MMTDGHIYTLNHDIKRLEQKEDEDDHYAPTVCDTYYINEDAKPRKAKMLRNIDDILQVVREMPAPEDPKEKSFDPHSQGGQPHRFTLSVCRCRIFSRCQFRVWSHHGFKARAQQNILHHPDPAVDQIGDRWRSGG